MKPFLARNHRLFLLIAIVLFSTAWLTACGLPGWIQTAQSILPIAAQMALGILSLIAALSGKTIDAGTAATLAAVVQKIQSGLTDISTMVNEYLQSPSTGLLQEIEAGTKAVIDNINHFLADTGITDQATNAKITAVLQLILQEVQALESLMPVLTASAMAKVSFTVPWNKSEFKMAYNNLLNAPSGSADVDTALAKLKRL